MRKNIAKTRLIILGMGVLITGTIWISAELYHRYVADHVTQQYQTQIKSLNPRLNTEVLQRLSQKRSLPVSFPDLPQTP